MEDSNGNTITLNATGIHIDSTAKLSINGQSLEIDAGYISVNSAMAHFSGVVKCDALISNSVISASYTPGAWNIW